MEIEKYLITGRLLWWVDNKGEKLEKHAPGILSGQNCESIYLGDLHSFLRTGYRLVTARALAINTIKTVNT